jgi:hypothetical protein
MIKTVSKILFYMLPIFIGLPALYLFVELFFVNAFINTYSTSTNVEELRHYENYGRLLSAFGIALSIVVAKATKEFQSNGWNISVFSQWGQAATLFFKSFISAFVLIFILMKAVVIYVDTPAARFCAGNGHYLKELVQSGTYSPLRSWSNERSFININQHQVALTILPYSFCSNKNVRNEALNDKHFKELVYQDMFANLFENSPELKKYRNLVNGKSSLDGKISQLYTAYSYILDNKGKGTRRVNDKVSKGLRGNAYSKEIYSTYHKIYYSDKHRGIKRSFSNFKKVFKANLAIEIMDIDFKVKGGLQAAENVLGKQFVANNRHYFYQPKQKGISSAEHIEKKLASYTLLKTLVDMENGTLEKEVNRDMFVLVESMVMPVVVLAISAFSMLMLVINVLISCLRLAFLHNSFVEDILDAVTDSEVTLFVTVMVALCICVVASFIFPVVLIALLATFILAVVLVGLNKLIDNINDNTPSRYEIPLLFSVGEGKSTWSQAFTHPILLVYFIFICVSHLPPTNSEKALLNDGNDSMVESLIKMGARFQFHVFPITINQFKQSNINPWLPHKKDNEKINEHFKTLNQSYKKNRLLTPVYNSVAWNSLVLANHGALQPSSINQIHSMFNFYNRSKKYNEKARYAKAFLANNIKTFK